MNHAIAARALCEFVARQGDLDVRFTPSPTALEGMEGHQKVVARRPEHYIAELSLKGTFYRDGDELVVSGRADGFDPTPGQQRLEEIKTHRGSLERQPVNHRALHWAQAKLYGWLACEHYGLEQLDVALVYFDVEHERETPLVERCSREQLETHFEQCCHHFLGWARQEAQHQQQRQQALLSLSFPKADFRPGQRTLAETVYKAAHLQRPLLLQAPTGIGKTLGTLFPLLKAWPRQHYDRLFFLTARTTGRQLALDAIDQVNQVSHTPLRGLELIAREKSCEHPDLACHGESCPLAAGFYDRLPRARQQAVDRVAEQGLVLDGKALRSIALEANICPYYFGQEMARWCDVVVGDYNHYLGMGGMLHALSQQQHWRVGLLFDEAHNLIERGRMMFTTELDEGAIRALAKEAPKGLGSAVKRLARTFYHERCRLDDARRGGEREGLLEALPTALVAEVKGLVGRIGERLADQPDQPLEGALMRFYFDALRFTRLLELHDADLFQWEFERRPGRHDALRVRLKNLIPGPLLADRFSAAQAAILFSATLAPSGWFKDLLGLPEHTAWHDIASPFTAQQLKVSVVADISTRYHQREASITPIARTIAAGYQQRPGNYLAFFSSFDYLQRVADELARIAPHIGQWQQGRRMDENERHQFIERFQPQGQGVGFAVLGGIFGEGIDLPGERLVGAFVATLGLPQFNPFNQALTQRLATRYDRATGYRYTYLYPGLTKVVQAAGRIIRSEGDTGALWLIDDRFQQAEVQALLPGWWQIQSASADQRP